MSDERKASEGRKYQIQSLWGLHHEILRLALLGWKQVDIANELNVTEVTVSTCLNSEVAKRRLEIMRGARDSEALDLSIEIKRFAPEALTVLQDMLRDPNTGQRNKITIAMDVLDRAGYAPPKVVEARHLHAYFTKEEIEELKQRAKESKMIEIEGQVVEST